MHIAYLGAPPPSAQPCFATPDTLYLLDAIDQEALQRAGRLSSPCDVFRFLKAPYTKHGAFAAQYCKAQLDWANGQKSKEACSTAVLVNTFVLLATQNEVEKRMAEEQRDSRPTRCDPPPAAAPCPPQQPCPAPTPCPTPLPCPTAPACPTLAPVKQPAWGVTLGWLAAGAVVGVAGGVMYARRKKR